jgi:hypothetical protein
MATVNKDFKIKSGLIVEGTTGTINGQDILTTSQASTDHIVSIVGGTTLVTSVAGNLNVVNGELSIDEVGVATDLAGSRLYTDGSTLNVDGEGLFDDFVANGMATTTNVSDAISTEVTNRNSAIATAKGEAITAAESYTDGEITTALTTAQGYATTAENNANGYTDTAISGEVTNRNSAIDSAISTEVTNRNSAISTAISGEVTDRNNAIDSAITNLNLSGTYDALGAADAALADANIYTDNAVSDLVGSAPALLDTLQELATALQDNPDVIANIQDVAAGKQNSFTAGAGLEFNVMGDILKVSDNTYDAYGAASAAQTAAEGYADDVAATAEQNAKTYALGLAPNYDAAGAATSALSDANDYTDTAISNLNLTTSFDAYGAASTAQSNAETFATNAINALDTDAIEEGNTNLYYTDSRVDAEVVGLLTNATLNNIQITADGYNLTITAENGVADSTTDDLEEGSTNLYFTDSRAVSALEAVVPNFVAVELNAVAKQVASTLSAPTAGIQIGHAFAKAEYRSAEFLVKVAYGTHTEISKVLLTLDTSDNIAITEYGIVGTNGSASSVSADISGNNVQLLVTTANNNSTVTVVGTLLA